MTPLTILLILLGLGITVNLGSAGLPRYVGWPMFGLAVSFWICALLSHSNPKDLNSGIFLASILTVVNTVLWLFHTRFELLSDRLRSAYEFRLWVWLTPTLLAILVLLYIYYVEPGMVHLNL